MAEGSVQCLSISLCLLFSCLLVLGSGGDGRGGKNSGEVAGMFVFGSSLVDNGNNNFVKNSSARADFFPYGIDFKGGPSGRFSNGRNPVDVLGQLLKLPAFLPPFADPKSKGKRILHGVNFASGGSGILDQTGSVAGGVTCLRQQIQNFESVTIPELRSQLCGDNVDEDGDNLLSSHLSESLFVLGTGGNDYMLNFFLSPTPTPSNSTAQHPQQKISLQDFTANLVENFSTHLKRLYDLGGRKFVILSVQVMGCVPVVLRRSRVVDVADGNGCVEVMNEAALLFNSQLKHLVATIGMQMPGSNLVFVDSYKIIKSFIDNPRSKGFRETRKACCETDIVGIMCKRGGRTCRHRCVHIFFDGLHPTDIVNAWIAKKAYSSNLNTDVYPFNVSRLASL